MVIEHKSDRIWAMSCGSELWLLSIRHLKTIPDNRMIIMIHDNREMIVPWSVWLVALSCGNHMSLISRSSSSGQKKFVIIDVQWSSLTVTSCSLSSERNMEQWRCNPENTNQIFIFLRCIKCSCILYGLVLSQIQWFCWYRYWFIQKSVSSLKMIFFL